MERERRNFWKRRQNAANARDFGAGPAGVWRRLGYEVIKADGAVALERPAQRLDIPLTRLFTLEQLDRELRDAIAGD